MHLGNDSRPDIAFAVKQYTWFTHCPKESNAIKIKRILRYLYGKITKGMYIKPSQNLQVDCYVEADFAGLWGVEHDQDPTCVKSRAGYLIEFMSCPLRDLISTRGVLQEINDNVFDKRLEEPILRTHSRTFTKIHQSVVYEDNEACLQFRTMPNISSRTKHIAIPYHFFRSKVNSLEFKVVAIDANNQKAD